jgi:hypothetical protein
MLAIFPEVPVFSYPEVHVSPVCALIVTANIAERDCVRMSKALPSGMPDRLELHIVHGRAGVEKSTAIVYGAHAYLVDFRIDRRRVPDVSQSDTISSNGGD